PPLATHFPYPTRFRSKLAVLAAYWVGRWYAAQNLVMKLRSVKLFALGMLGIWLLDASAPIDPIFWGMLLAELGIRAVLYARRVRSEEHTSELQSRENL